MVDRTSVKDGSITVGSSVEPGARLQLFVRDRCDTFYFVRDANSILCTCSGPLFLFPQPSVSAFNCLRQQLLTNYVICCSHVVILDFIREAAGNEFSAALLAYKRRELMETLASTTAEGFSEDSTGDVQESNQNVGVVDSVVSTPSSGKPEQSTPFRAAGALIFPGLDRGRTLWGEDHFQSSSVVQTVPVPLGGFFANGVAGELENA